MKICRLGLLGHPALLEGRLVLGMALTSLGRHDEVLQEMRVALETDPQSALAWLMKGEALFGKGDFAQAEAALDKASALDPTNPKAEQLLAQITNARAAGFQEVPAEATGTKEYPARAGVGLKWRSGGFGAPEEISSSVGPPDAISSTVERLAPAGAELDAQPVRRGDDNDEHTSVDPDPADSTWDGSRGPDTAPAFSQPVNETLVAPIVPVVSTAPAAPRKPAPQAAMRVTVLAPLRDEPSAPLVAAVPPPPAHVAGPEEATMFGVSRKLADPPLSVAADPREDDFSEPTVEAASARPVDRSTLEMKPAGDRPLVAPPAPAPQAAPWGAKLPSAAQTMLAARSLLAPREGNDGRRREQPTIEQQAQKLAPLRDRDDDAFVPRRASVLAPAAAAGDDELGDGDDGDDDRDFFPPEPDISDASISLSVNEVVFAPRTADELVLDVTPLPRALSSGDGLDPDDAPSDDDGPRPFDSMITDEAHLRARRRASAAPAPAQLQRRQTSAPPAAVVPPVRFVAQVPLDGMVSSGGYSPRPEELHPRISGPPDPARGRKPTHLASDLEQPRPRSDARSVEPARPQKRALPPRSSKSGLLSRALEALPIRSSRGPRSWLALAGVLVAVVATGVVAGLLVREWRLRGRVAQRHELAVKKLTSGNYPGYQAAELLYRQILAERDDQRAAAMRAKVLSQLSFEFGEAPEPAQRAVQALGAGTMPEEREARIYLALAKGELELAARQATALVKDRPGPQARYLLGQAQLLLDQPEDAANALRTAAAEDPQNPLVLHALGLAEAALRRSDRAFDAYGKALIANANHVATIIDRALLQLRQGLDREAAAGSLEGVVGKLVGDASPGQLARAYVGLAEIELGKGNVAAARSALSSAAARRRDHPLLLEELAKAYADAFELEPAEREARRALAVSGRLTPRLILAEVALRRSRPVQALTLLEESGSSRPEALVLRALAKLELGRNTEARADAELAMRLDATLVSASVALARVDIAESRYDAALKRLEDMEEHGKYAEVAWALGQVYLARRQPDRARTCFREALHRQPLLLQARLALARLLHDAGQLGEAREEVNHILATNAAYVPARRELAALALDLGDAIAARDEFDALSERDADVDTLLGGARARLLLGDARGAEERIERALKLRPSGGDLEAANCLKARALLADHRANESIQLLLKVVPTAVHGEPLALLIESYLDYGRADWAERAIELAPVVTRTGIELTLAKARLSLEQARQAAGKALAEEALGRLHSGRSPVWLRAQALALVGRADFELGNARGAWKSLKSALELDPRNVRAQFMLGMTALELKRPEDAVSAFEGALANDSRFAEAQFYLGRTRRELADPRAEESLRAYIDLEPRGAFADEARRLLRGEAVTPTNDQPRSRRRAR